MLNVAFVHSLDSTCLTDVKDMVLVDHVQVTVTKQDRDNKLII